MVSLLESLQFAWSRIRSDVDGAVDDGARNGSDPGAHPRSGTPGRSERDDAVRANHWTGDETDAETGRDEPSGGPGRR